MALRSHGGTVAVPVGGTGVRVLVTGTGVFVSGTDVAVGVLIDWSDIFATNASWPPPEVGWKGFCNGKLVE